jgi:DNA (cytosine-5)-methyltransferase 1
LVEPLVTEYYGNGGTKPVSEPLGTVTTKDRFALLEPFVFNTGHSSARDRARSINEPLTTVVTKAEHCLVEPAMRLDIKFRMLKNHELKRAQGFPDDYILTGNITEQTKQIGNAVPVNTAKALAKSAMEA